MPTTPRSVSTFYPVATRFSAGRKARRVSFHVARVCLFAAVLWMIRDQHRWFVAQQHGADGPAIKLETVQSFYPEAVHLDDWAPATGGRIVEAADGDALGYVLQTSPDCDSIIGYAGPTNSLIALDQDHRVLGIKLLTSQDNPKYVHRVADDARFLDSFVGLTRSQIRPLKSVDGVSGATLTSLAIAQSLVARLGGTQPSFRFPQPIAVSEIRRFFSQAVKVASVAGWPAVLHVLDVREKRIGLVARTAPAADDLVGYAGPTDTLIALDNENRVQGIAIRKSYDTEEYVGWVRDDDDFMTLFNGKTLDELATLDIDAAEIEGVSGATMTSITIAEGLVRAAQKTVESHRAAERSITIDTRNLGTALMVLWAVCIGLTRLRGRRWLRVLFQIALILYLGFINGDLLSQSVLVGWTQSAVPWRLAPGFVVLTLAAFLVPITTKRQLYCHYLCPHGAAQELLRRRLPWHLRLPHWLSTCLKALPACLLLLVLAVAMRHIKLDLTGIEPFDAYMVRFAGRATVIIALVGLATSLVIPMAYCRFGCPTGALLRFLRWNGRSDRVSRRDVAAIALLLVAIGLRFV